MKADVSKPGECEVLVTQTLSHFGCLAYACNNAGVGGEQNMAADYSVEGWQQVINTNLSASFVTGAYFAVDGGYLAR